MDINAVGKDDKGNEICYYANQFIWEENPGAEHRIDLEEFQPVLEVRSIVWMGTHRGLPLISITVTDGDQDIQMRISLRNDLVRSRMVSKYGPIFKGRMNVGCRFRLEEYTTGLLYCRDEGCHIPVVYVERVHAEPRSASKKKRTVFCPMLTTESSTLLATPKSHQ